MVDKVKSLNPTATSKAIDYPAIGVEILKPTYYTGNYTNSVRSGVQALTSYINSFVGSTCGKETYLYLAGFSQGAQVVGDAYQALPAATKQRVGGVVLIADPKFRGAQGSPVAVGNYSAAANGIQQQTTSARTVTPTDPVRSYCEKNDVVCQFNSDNVATAATNCYGTTGWTQANCPHLKYMINTLPSSGLTYTTMAANYLVSRWKALPASYASVNVGPAGSLSVQAYFGQLKAVTESLAGKVRFNTSPAYLEAYSTICALTVVFSGVKGTSAAVYAQGLDFGGALENPPNHSVAYDSGNVHQQLVYPRYDVPLGKTWNGYAWLVVDGVSSYSKTYALTLKSTGFPNQWTFSGKPVACAGG